MIGKIIEFYMHSYKENKQIKVQGTIKDKIAVSEIVACSISTGQVGLPVSVDVYLVKLEEKAVEHTYNKETPITMVSPGSILNI